MDNICGYQDNYIGARLLAQFQLDHHLISSVVIVHDMIGIRELYTYGTLEEVNDINQLHQ